MLHRAVNLFAPSPMPDFRSPQFIRDHIDSILAFYQPHVIDSIGGGFHQNFLDDGSVFAPGSKHLVSSARMVINYCQAYRNGHGTQYRSLAERGLEFLRSAHWCAARQGYHWTLQDGIAGDQTNHCYVLAFVLLAYAHCQQAGVGDTGPLLEETWQLMERHFWQPTQKLYADEASADWQLLSPYRGQNANMHSCEALLAAYAASRDETYLDRAFTLARTITCDLAAKSDHLVWEHYLPDLSVDWQYNRDDPKNLYRPWGFQPGHQTEWAKLLLTLYRQRPEDWMVERARDLFDRALQTAWDEEHGGILYGFAPDGTICDDDKYFWVQAESLVAAAMLAQVRNESRYWDWYDRIWTYVWSVLVDHRHGAWYRVLRRDNSKYTNEKSIAGAKCDYHTMGACWEIMPLL